MKNRLKMKTIFLAAITIICSFTAISQNKPILLKEKVILAFTKKKQISALNHKVDSLNYVIKTKDIQLSENKFENDSLKNEVAKKCTSIAEATIQNNSLEAELTKNKIALDSLKHEMTDNKLYSAFQRNEDSLRYQNLLHKLSERNTFIVDSLKAMQALRKNKLEPTKVETYYFKNYKSIITGTPDEKNRFTYTFELYQKTGEEYVKSENVSLFNEKKQELLDKINAKIQKDFVSSYKIDPKCFTSNTPPTYDFKKLGIEFKDGKVNFYAVFDFTTENCYYLYGYTSVEFTEAEIKAYLK